MYSTVCVSPGLAWWRWAWVYYVVGFSRPFLGSIHASLRLLDVMRSSYNYHTVTDSGAHTYVDDSYLPHVSTNVEPFDIGLILRIGHAAKHFHDNLRDVGA
jgi:hypothetical protein